MKIPHLLIDFVSKFINKVSGSNSPPVVAQYSEPKIHSEDSSPQSQIRTPAQFDPLDVPLIEAVQSSECSVRLKNALLRAQMQGTLPHLTLRDYVSDQDWGFENYTDLPDFGAKIVLELASVLDQIIEQRQYESIQGTPIISDSAVDSQLEPSWDEIVHLLSNHPLASDQYIWLTAQHLSLPWPTQLPYVQLQDLRELTVEELGERLNPYKQDEDHLLELATLHAVVLFWTDSNNLKLIEELSPETLAMQTVNQCLPRISVQVLFERQGSASSPKQTLAQIGQSLGLSRERIRQIEANALRRLNEPKPQAYLKILLHSRQRDLEQYLLGETGCIKQSDLPKGLENLDIIGLAVRSLYGTLSKFAVANFTQFRNLYLNNAVDQQKLEREFETIDNAIQHQVLPVHVEVAASDMQVEVDSLVYFATGAKDFGIYDGYLHQGGLSARKQRAIELFQVLSGCLGGETTEFRTVFSTYRFAYPDSTCSTRDLHNVLYEYSDNVLSLTDDGFVAVNRWCRLKDRAVLEGSSPPPIAEQDFRQFNPGTSYAELINLVDEIGPAALLDIRGEFSNRFGDRWSINSVFPILKSTHYFVRMAPGIVGTLPMLDQPEKLKMCAALESETQVKCYTYAILSNSCFIYPLWNPEVEYHWCELGDGRLPWKTYASLLAVSNPDHWPISEQKKQVWRARIAEEGRNMLTIKPLPLHHTIPKVREICALARFVADKPTVSWLDVNRVLGNRIDSRASMSFLAVLAKLGIVNLADDWLYPIEVNAGAGWRFFNEIVCSGRLNSSWGDVPELFDSDTKIKSYLINPRALERLLEMMISNEKDPTRKLKQMDIFEDV